MALRETPPSAEELSKSVTALKGVKGCELNTDNGFCCVTIEHKREVHGLMQEIEHLGLETEGIFIHDPKRKDMPYIRHNKKEGGRFDKSTEEEVIAHRFH